MASSHQEIPLTSPRRSNFTESTSKPIIVIVSPTTPAVSETDSPPSSPSSQQPSSPPAMRRSSYTSLLAKISRDAHLLTVTSLDTLEETLTQHAPRIAGFIISSTAILHPIHHALAMRLAELAHNNHTEPPTSPPSTSPSNLSPPSFVRGGSERGRRIYTIIFALSFASTAISTPLLFASFMRTIFHLPWRLSGMTNQKVKTKLRASVLRKLGQRVYRVRYCFRSVFLRNVKLADKVVVATGDFPVGGQRVSTSGMGMGLGVDVAFWLGDGSGDFDDNDDDDDDDGDGDGYGEGGDGTETASTDEEMEEDWQSEESEGTAVGGDFGDGYSFAGEEGEYLQGGPADLVVNGDGDAAMQVDEDAGFLADVEDNEVDGLDAHPIVTTTTTFVVGNHVNGTSMGISNGTHQVDDVFSDNSTFLSPTSLLTNSPAATVSTPATTTVASSFDEDDEDDDDDEEAETALTAGTIIQTIEGEEDVDGSEDLDLDFNLSTTHTHAHITNHNNNPSLNLIHATHHALNLPTTNTAINDLDTENNDESITPPPPLHPTDTDWVPSDNEGTSVDLCCADSPIVIHEFKRTVVRDDGVQEKVPCGYVGFVGHVDDSRSMSTLILGMCAVPKFVEGA